MNIFLSASIPLPDRDEKFFATSDIVSIREAVKGLVLVLIEKKIDLIFGGHPAITPLVIALFQQAGFAPGEHVTLYQSEYFRKKFPVVNKQFTKIVVTEDVDDNREKSLHRMREQMIGGHEFLCGIFIGGMEGVLDEYEAFRRHWPNAPTFPIASTGAAAAEIFRQYNFGASSLAEEYTYPSLFRSLINGMSPPAPRPRTRKFNG